MSTKLIALLVFSTGFPQVSASDSRRAFLKSEKLLTGLELPGISSACERSNKRARFDLCVSKEEPAYNTKVFRLSLQGVGRRNEGDVTKLKATVVQRDYAATCKSGGVKDSRGPVKAGEAFRRLADLYELLPVHEEQQGNCSVKQVAMWLPVPNPKRKGGTIKKTGNTVKRRLDFDEQDENVL